MVNLAKALLVAMQEIGYLQKDKQVGEGKSAYKALSDNKATQGIREALIKAGIVALPTRIVLTDKCAVTNWQEQNQYGNASTKTHVFTEVLMTYTLIHAESGESAEIQAIGHGIDNGDKSAGKAMTYAKKNALLNALLISSGLDPDDTHSDDLPMPPTKQATPAERARQYINTNAQGEHRQAWLDMLEGCRSDNEVINLAKELASVLAQPV